MRISFPLDHSNQKTHIITDMRLPFLGLLPMLQPVFQQPDDDFFHLLDRVGFGEILPKGVMTQRDRVVQRLLFL